MFICYFQQRDELQRQVTMVANFLDLTLSWQRRSFAFSNDGRKLWATGLFLSAIMLRKVIHVNFLRFFCHICRTTVCWDPKILLPWQREVTTSLLYYAVSWCEVWKQKIFGASHISYNTAYYSERSVIPRVFRLTKSFFGFGIDSTDRPQTEKPPVSQLQTRIWFSSRYRPRSSVRSVKTYFNLLLQRTISVKCNQEYMTSKGKPTWTEFPFTYRLLILICTRKDEVLTSSLSIRSILDSFFFVLNCRLESYVCRRSYFRYGPDTCLHCDEKWHKHISNATISFQDQVDRASLHPV